MSRIYQLKKPESVAAANQLTERQRVALLEQSAKAIYLLALTFSWMLDTVSVSDSEKERMETVLNDSLDLVHQIHEAL